MHFNQGMYCSHCTANATMKRIVGTFLQAVVSRFPILVFNLKIFSTNGGG